MSSDSFPTLDVTHARRELAKLYEQVAMGKGRVEITRRGSRQSCVIISKEELESLEKALEILADTEGVREVRDALAHVVAASQLEYPAP
jgi:prevent-host-death family protein